VPSLVLGIAVAFPASTARAAFSASRVSLLPRSRRSRRSVRITYGADTGPSHRCGQPGVVGTGALDRERQRAAAELTAQSISWR
jgi:hypothetical protein